MKILQDKKELSIQLFAHKTPYVLIDRLVVKDFDEDDNHRIADSVTTAFYEGEGEVTLEINGHKLCIFPINLNWME